MLNMHVKKTQLTLKKCILLNMCCQVELILDFSLSMSIVVRHCFELSCGVCIVPAVYHMFLGIVCPSQPL